MKLQQNTRKQLLSGVFFTEIMYDYAPSTVFAAKFVELNDEKAVQHRNTT